MSRRSIRLTVIGLAFAAGAHACGIDVPPGSVAPGLDGALDTSSSVDGSVDGDSPPGVDAGPFGDPSLPGPYGFDSYLDRDVASAPTLVADVFVPHADTTFPLLVLRHGLTRTKGDVRAWGEHLASHGMTVALLQAAEGTDDDPEAGGNDLLRAIDGLVEPASAAELRIDTTSTSVGGHSSGGLAAIVAASKRPTLRALVLLDTEGADLGETLASGIAVPTIAGFAEPDDSVFSCNEHGRGTVTTDRLLGETFAFRVVGASHCDAELSKDLPCAVACGGRDEKRLAAFRTYVTAGLRSVVRCHPQALPYVGGPLATSDTRIHVLRAVNVPSSCP